MLRDWRLRRRMSQLELASGAGISARHLSFVETGRARPSREMVLHLAEHLDVPLRERNPLLIAAGYAPTYHATDLDAPEMQSVRAAIDRLLVGHEPYLSSLISLLSTGGPNLSLTLKKGGLCRLEAEPLRCARCASLEWLLAPRLLGPKRKRLKAQG